MPLAFPSHQGLILPLWKRFPDSFNVLALYIGAGIPDAVDGLVSPFRGGLGQWYGHTLLGSFLFCLPLGWVFFGFFLYLGRRLSALPRTGWIGQGLLTSGAFRAGTSRRSRLFLIVWSVWVGAMTHDLIDFFSHKNFLFLRPWYENNDIFPLWWTREWFAVPVPGYTHPYSVGWHLVSWLALGILGILLYAYSIRHLIPFKKRQPDSN